MTDKLLTLVSKYSILIALTTPIVAVRVLLRDDWGAMRFAGGVIAALIFVLLILANKYASARRNCRSLG
jgi:hypothetical protein